MSKFENYVKKHVQAMRPYVPGEDLTGISVSPEDAKLPTLDGGYIAVNPNNENDQWYVSKKFFDENYEKAPDKKLSDKTFDNTTASQAKDNVRDIVFWGNGDTFKLISKAFSKAEGWMKSTKAMEIEGLGCVVQVTTQQGDNVAEALTFVPNAKILQVKNEHGVVVERRLYFYDA